MIEDDRALEAFLAELVTLDWRFQHDARYPQHAELIAAWRPRFNESLTNPVAGMHERAGELDAAGVPLFAISNFSYDSFRRSAANGLSLSDRFRDIVVGDEKLVKADAAIYRLSARSLRAARGRSDLYR